MMPALAVGLLTGVLSFGQSSTAVVRDGSWWTQTSKGSIAASGVERVRIHAEGGVALLGNSGTSVSYSLKERVRASNSARAESRLRAFRIESRRVGAALHLTFTTPTAGYTSAELTVAVPRDLPIVEIESLGGDASATNFDGILRLVTGGGQIDADRLQNCFFKTAGGDIRIGLVAGPLQCYTGGGTIHVSRASGDAHLETAGGDIDVGEIDGGLTALTGGGNIHITRSLQAVVAKTRGGLIEVQHAGGLVTAQTAAGSIQVTSSQGVHCASTNGTIRLRNVAGVLRASTESGSILAELRPGESLGDSTLSTNAGDITVLIPPHMALTVFARNESRGATGRIISDFPEIHSAAYHGLLPQTAQGSLNGGGPKLRLVAAGGTIFLRRSR
ncbi:MAG TPA: hypothetical protein VN788_11260 [Verrucomicrobiae bacterium]|nr:hypothetical protein [Verrucomicrobiae bacterium]